MAGIRVEVRIMAEELSALKKAIPDKVGHLQSGADLLRWAVAQAVGESLQPVSINHDPFKRIRRRPRVTGKVVTLVTIVAPDALNKLLEMAPPSYRATHAQAVRWTVVGGVMGLRDGDLDQQMIKVSRGRKTHTGFSQGRDVRDTQKMRRSPRNKQDEA